MLQIRQAGQITTRTALSVALLVGILAISIFILMPESKESGTGDQDGEKDVHAEFMTEKNDLANSLLESNKPAEAVVLMDEMLAVSDDPITTNTLIITKASVLSAMGDLELTYTAIALLGDLLSSEEVEPVFKGWAMSELLQMYYRSQHSEVLAHIQKLPVFAEISELPPPDFLQRAAEMSDSLSPTAFGKIALAVPLARELTYSSMTMDPTEMKSKAEKIDQLVNSSQLLQAEEGWLNVPYNLMMAAHYRGILLSAAVLGEGDPSLPQKHFEEALQVASDNPEMLQVQLLEPYIHFYYAAHLLQNSQDIEATEQLTQLVQVIEMFDDKGGFAEFARAANSNPDSNNYRLFQAFTEHSSAFSDFLQNEYSLTF